MKTFIVSLLVSWSILCYSQDLKSTYDTIEKGINSLPNILLQYRPKVIDNIFSEAKDFEKMGVEYMKQQDQTHAIESFKVAVFIYLHLENVEYGNKSCVMKCNGNLATDYVMMASCAMYDNPDEADVYVGKSSELLQTTTIDNSTCELVYHTLGEYYYLRATLNKASNKSYSYETFKTIGYFEKAVSCTEIQYNYKKCGDYCDELSKYCEDLGDYVNANKYKQKSIDFYSK